MEFYENMLGEEMGKDQFISLQRLIKYNEGLYKSQKQGKFIFDRWTVEIDDRPWIKNMGVPTPEGSKAIVIDGYYSYGHGHGRGQVPATVLYIVDIHGVVSCWKGKHKMAKTEEGGCGGWALNSVVKVWERTCETPEIEPEPKPEPKPESQHFGEVGKRYKGIELKCVFISAFENDYGITWLHKFEDQEGNVFVWFSSSTCLVRYITYTMNATVKEHSEYKDVKQTVLTRCLKVKEVA